MQRASGRARSITVDGEIAVVASGYGLVPGDIESERRYGSVEIPRVVASGTRPEMLAGRHSRK